MVGSEAGAEWLATGEYDEIVDRGGLSCGIWSGSFFVTSSLFFLSFCSESFCRDLSTFWTSILVRYNTFVEEQY